MQAAAETEPQRRPLPASRWTQARTMTAALVLQFSLGLVYVWGQVAPYVRAHSQWPPLLVSCVWSAGPIGYAIGMVAAGRLADRVPPRRLCWSSLGLMAFGLGTAFAFPSGPTFVLLYAFLGLGMGGGVGMAGSLAAGVQVFRGRVGAVGGAVTGSYALAALVQVPVAAWLLPSLGWTDTVRVMGVALVLLAGLALAMMPPLPGPPQAQVAERIEPAHRMFLRPLIWTGYLLELCSSTVGSHAFVNVVTYARGLQLPVALATAALTTVAAGNAVGRLGGGAAADRFGVHAVLLAILLLNLAGAVLLSRAGAGTLLIATVAVGLGFGAPAGILSRLAAQAMPLAPHSAFGLLFMGYAAGSFSGPLIGAVLGASSLSWLLMTGFPLAGLVLLAYRSRFAPSA